MPKVKKAVKATKPTKKQKLSPAERSQIAKDRWAKIRKAKAAKLDIAGIVTNVYFAPPETNFPIQGVVENAPAPPIVEQESEAHTMGSTASVYRQNSDGSFTEISGGIDIGQGLPPAAPPVEAPAPQLAPVKAPKSKRYTGPKEFSVALKAAENRLAKAITERATAAGQLAALNAEIPSLLQIIQALKGSSNVSPVPYDVSGSYPNSGILQTPIPPQFQTLVDPMDAIRAAMAAPPVSRAIGNAVQLPPDVIGDLEGPDDDDDPDRFITGPLAGGGWK